MPAAASVALRPREAFVPALIAAAGERAGHVCFAVSEATGGRWIWLTGRGARWSNGPRRISPVAIDEDAASQAAAKAIFTRAARSMSRRRVSKAAGGSF